MEKIIDFLVVYYRNYNSLIKEGKEQEAFKQLYYNRGMSDALTLAFEIECMEEYKDDNLISKLIFYKNQKIIEEKECL